jgi:hypothetical protein
MNCQSAQIHLLNLERPDQPPPVVASHLNRCSACREWYQRLLQLEANLPLLPVPASDAKARLLAEFRTIPRGLPVQPPGLAGDELPWARYERRLKRVSVALALTAALVLIALGLAFWRLAAPQASPPLEPTDANLLAALTQRKPQLPSAKTPRQRIEVLADLADDLTSEARARAEAADTANLNEVVLLYQRLVEEGIVTQAQTLTDQPDVLSAIADRLGRAGSETEDLAGRVPAHSAEALRTIAAAAREGDRRLRVLMRGEKS